MKKYILAFIIFLFSFISFGQIKNNEIIKNDDTTITINVSKINKGLGNVVSFFKNEISQFKNETKENMTPEMKANIDTIKSNIKYELKYIHDAIHQGYITGLQGKEYTPPYKHK